MQRSLGLYNFVKSHLLHGQMHHAQVVQDLPVKRCEVVGSFKAGDAGHELLLAEEAHPDVVPKLRRLCKFSLRCCTVFGLLEELIFNFRTQIALKFHFTNAQMQGFWENATI